MNSVMSGLTAVLSLALATHAVSVNDYPLREGCDSSDRVIAELQAGDPVTIRFSLAGDGGACYKVSVTTGGETLQGYVSEAGITGVEDFDAARRAAAPIAAPAVVGSGAADVPRPISIGGASDPGARAARLIDANRPREALAILEKEVEAHRDDAGLLSLAGYAAYRSDDMRRAMEYWERSLALNPSPTVKRLYDRAVRENNEDQSGQRLHGTRFLLRYNRDEMEAGTAREIVRMLEQEFSRISMELGCRADERIVAIVQTPEEYQRTTAAAEWSAGQYNGRIRVAASDQSHLSERTRQIFAHELVHACMAGLGDFPAWLHEGLAQKMAGEQLGAQEVALIQQMARANQLPRLDKFSQTFSRLSTQHATVAYATALAAVELFYQHYPGVGPRNLLRNPHMVPQIQADLDRRLRSEELAQLR